MGAVLYWDVDGPRIRKVLGELESAYEVRLAATMGDMLSMRVKGKDVCALVVGLSEAGRGAAERQTEALAEALAQAPPGRDICPLFVLTKGERSRAAAQNKNMLCLGSEDIPLLRRMIAAALADAEAETVKQKPSGGHACRDFVGGSRAMQKVLSLAEKYAESDHPVLILGETGTGKELVAKALHAQSARRAGPFIALNCSALPESLVESELFGAEKGAYTDAVRRKGALAKAMGGSLFLDEIGSMSLEVQPKLLRALETGEFWPLGAEKPEKSDFRLISATFEDMGIQIKRGLFRADLFYRISDLPIRLPPLRERAEDIPELARHFCRRAGRGRCDLTEGALGKLMGYEWPGNVRELKSVINRACANVQRGRIEPGDVVFLFDFTTGES